MKPVELVHIEEFRQAYPVMRELRPEVSEDDFLTIIGTARRENNYRLLAFKDQNRYLALIGCRILTDLVHGRHMYIDDLIVTSDRRSQGLGARLLREAERLARESGCKGLRLSTGLENESAQKFYEREGWSMRSVVFKKRLNSSKAGNFGSTEEK